MAYKVISRFKDIEDKNKRVYEVGEEYKGKTNKERLHTLSTANNVYERPFIEEIKEEPKKETKKKAKKEAGE